MPWVLCPDAVELLGFLDEALITALHCATPAIMDVLRGRRASRIFALFEHWFEESKTESTQDLASTATSFSMAFTPPIFPAHADCVLPFLGFVEVAARNTVTFSSSHHTTISHIASALYRVIVVRHHLNVSPEVHDLILLLAFRGPLPSFEPPLRAVELSAAEGRLKRIPTANEQAYALSIPGAIDTHVLPSLAAIGSLRRVPTGSIQDITTTSSPIHALGGDGSAFDFPLSGSGMGPDPGLHSSGDTPLPPIPREFRAMAIVSSSLPPPRPRPRMRGAQPSTRIPPTELANLDGSPLFDIIPAQRVLRSRAEVKSRVPPSPPAESIPAKKRKGSKSWYAYIDVYGNILPSSDVENDG